MWRSSWWTFKPGSRMARVLNGARASHQTVMIRWYHEAMRNRGDAGRPEALNLASQI